MVSIVHKFFVRKPKYQRHEPQGRAKGPTFTFIIIEDNVRHRLLIENWRVTHTSSGEFMGTPYQGLKRYCKRRGLGWEFIWPNKKRKAA